MSQALADRNLLFGVLAVQMDFVTREQLVNAMNAWSHDKTRSVGDILRSHKVIAADEQELLDALVNKHLVRHGNELGKCLESIGPAGPIGEALSSITDPMFQTSLGTLLSRGPAPIPDNSGATNVDVYATRVGTMTGTPTSPTPAAATERTGRFRVVRPHARGGLGEVFVANDGELNREVALKEIQGQYADHTESRTRFVLEAEITGALEHPGIVPVYGLGQYPDGRPFYAMRFIRGDSLQDAVKRFHAADSADRDPGERALALRGLLRRFIDVCHAIAYAHSRGVIHRDLKPGNVMLGQFGETLVVDWGLAKPLGATAAPETLPLSVEGAILPSSLGESAPTYAGMAVGTPQYMSPEQAAGRVEEMGPPSDVYSLGATLYSVLTGKPPLEATNIADLLMRVQRGDIPPARSANPRVPAALEAICQKAMQILPENRYTSPKLLADDVECWLADEPVSAWREPWIVRARRWARRHRTGVTTAAAILIVAGISLAIATVLLTAANKRERAAKLEAQANYKLARQAVDKYHTEVSEDVLLHEPGMEPLRRKLLESAREFYTKFVEQRTNDPEVKAELGRALYRLAQITADVESNPKGVELHRQALAIFNELAATKPDDSELLADKAACLHHLGRLQQELDLLAGSRESYEGAIALWTQLRDKQPDEPRYRNDEARSRLGLGNVEQALRRVERAREEYTKALAIREPLAAENPERNDFARDLAVTRHNLAMVQTSAGPADQAAENFAKALAAQEKLAKANPNVTQYQVDIARTHVNMGWLKRQKGLLPDAVAEFALAAELWKALADAHPIVWRFRIGQAKVLGELCQVRRANRNDVGAADACNQAQAIFKEMLAAPSLVPADKKEIAAGFRLLGDVHRSAARPVESRAAYEQALNLLEPMTNAPDALPEYTAELARVWNNLGLLARAEKKSALAEAAFRKAMTLWEGLTAAHPENIDYAAGLAVARKNLGDLAGEGGRAIAAAEFYGQAIGGLEDGKASRGETREARFALGNAFMARAQTFSDMRRDTDALPDWERAMGLTTGVDQLWVRVGQALTVARIGDHARAVTESDSLAPLAKTTGEVLYRLACAYSLCAEAVSRDTRVPSIDQKRLADEYAEKAVDMLRKATAVKYFEAPANKDKLLKSPDLKAVRELPAYGSLLQ
ncbi:MAG TPA: protein kinase [Gemmataceae bacterium]|jgi:serine/threonine-protein kinase|nr:protein kinase [Gemmataceae bacterium]